MFPALPTQTNNRKERGEPGKNFSREKCHRYREDLITCGRTNKLTYALLIEFTVLLIQLRKLYGRQNWTRQHYATLPGSMQAMESLHLYLLSTLYVHHVIRPSPTFPYCKQWRISNFISKDADTFLMTN